MPVTMESQSWPVTVKTRPGWSRTRWRRTGRSRGRRHSSDLRWSGGGTVPPLYSTGMPPERVVLALRVTGPVVGHLDPGQGRVAVEDEAEEVEGLALVPVGGRVRRARRWGCAGRRRGGDLEPDPAVVGHREQVVDRVQLATGVVGVVHAVDAGAELEAQLLVVAQQLDDRGRSSRRMKKVISPRCTTTFSTAASTPAARVAVGEGVGDVVHPAAVRRAAGAGQLDGAGQAAVAGGVAGAGDAEHALVAGDDLAGGLADGVERVVRVPATTSLPCGLVRLAHRSRPFIWLVGSALSAGRLVAPRSRRSRLTPSLVFWTWSCSLRIASISISGRGGQPGR